MRIFIPLSEVISMESTLDSSIMSISFFTYLRSIIGWLEGPLDRRSTELDQLPGEMREDRGSVRSEVHVVFDAHTAPVRPVNPRFDCHHRTFGERTVRGLRQPGRFVYFQAEA